MICEFPNKPVVPPAHLRRRLHDYCPACRSNDERDEVRRAVVRTVATVVATAVALIFAALIA